MRHSTNSCYFFNFNPIISRGKLIVLPKTQCVVVQTDYLQDR